MEPVNENEEHRPMDTSEDEVNQWIRLGLRLGVSAALHPFEYAKVLIQLGYEPVPARPGTTIFGKRTLIYPNIFQYVGYIRRIDGLNGCFRGLAPKVVGSICGLYFSDRIVRKLGMEVDENNSDESEMSDVELYEKFEKNLKRDIVIHVSGIILTQPFHIMSVRMMAQFIGREDTYTSILGSIIEIYRNEGILGFFAGIVPKILCDLACLILTSTTVFLANKYLIKEKESKVLFSTVTQFAYSGLLYPLQVVSTCMSVTGSGLNAGKPPHMPVYNNWTDCWNDLQARGELKRGSSLFWRSMRSNYAAQRYNFAPMPSITKYH